MKAALSFDENSFVPDIEQTVLGSLMFGEGGHETLALLKDYHFVMPFHQVFYRAIQAGRERYGSSLPNTVSKLITDEEKQQFEKDSGWKFPDYIAHLLSSAVSGANGSYARAKHVVNQWARISIANEAATIHAAASDKMADVKAIAIDAAKNLDDIMSDIRTGSNRKSRVSLGGAAQRAIETANEARMAGTGVTGVTWGLADINRMTGGILKRDLTLIGARPSMGKTTIALSVAINAAREGHSCGLVSLEMDAEKVAARALSDFMFNENVTIPYNDIIRGRVDERQIEVMADAQVRMEQMPLIIDDKSGQTISDIRVGAERMVEESMAAGNPLSVLFIDHLGLIRPSSRYSGNRTNEIAEMTGGLKSLARELDIAVVLLSQLSRALESREDKRPMLSDLRDSGAIEQDADMIAFVYRDHYYLERMKKENDMDHETKIHESRNKMEFIIAKQRNGPLGTVNLFADMSCSAVRNGTSDYAGGDPNG